MQLGDVNNKRCTDMCPTSCLLHRNITPLVDVFNYTEEDIITKVLFVDSVGNMNRRCYLSTTLPFEKCT